MTATPSAPWRAAAAGTGTGSACYADVPGEQLHVRRRDSGRPVLPLHDAGSSWARWADLIDAEAALLFAPLRLPGSTAANAAMIAAFLEQGSAP